MNNSTEKIMGYIGAGLNSIAVLIAFVSPLYIALDSDEEYDPSYVYKMLSFGTYDTFGPNKFQAVMVVLLLIGIIVFSILGKQLIGALISCALTGYFYLYGWLTVFPRDDYPFNEDDFHKAVIFFVLLLLAAGTFFMIYATLRNEGKPVVKAVEKQASVGLNEDIVKRLKSYKLLLNDNVITQEQFDEVKHKLLGINTETIQTGEIDNSDYTTIKDEDLPTL